ncbi:MAG: tetratricopeptide repeat protein [Deltaproteobacteria bacterium]|nr:tetratricopeptide repeat protein [Deltaproteobacteria bacterium]
MTGEGYTSAEVARLLEVSPAQVRGLVRAGFLAPARGPRGEMRFSFQDLVLMRTARALLAAEVPARRVRAALKQLRAKLPAGRPLSGLSIEALGGTVVVRDGHVVWQPESGQALFDFGRAGAAPEPGRAGGGAARAGGGKGVVVSTLQARVRRAVAAAETAEAAADAELEAERLAAEGAAAAALLEAAGLVPGGPVLGDELPEAGDIDGWYARGLDLERTAPAGAREAYARVLELDGEHLDALVNLGRLEHEAGHLTAAEKLYRRALALSPGDATAAFNLGVALEDQDRVEPAITAYRRALAADPGCADAHYNLSRLYERQGRTAAAIRHLSAYRRLTD